MNKLRLLGVNTVHYNIDEVLNHGLCRFEVCFGRQQNYKNRIKEINNEIEFGFNKGLIVSVHHPILLFDWYKEDYLSAFYLDLNNEISEKSFRLLEENIKEYSKQKIAYFVVHFPGVVLKGEKPRGFDSLLNERIERVNNIASKYDVLILLEYFGSNKWFYDVDKWIEVTKKCSNIGILTDTGHLHFASIMHNFNFMEALKKLSKHSEAFHLWTTKGNEVYSDSKYYKSYHHISANINQRVNDGWAFNTKEVLDVILKYDKPIIIESEPLYGGVKYLDESLKSIITYIKEKYDE
ncbi:TIM barrel protein [Helicovermis profundi]|uniref:Xylose isomerase-like TIM barrel domain-containing protein n=1 Tax=Helicovermis profundi TaxID=3065157 RepID=A0AAU9E0K4_9FIRM|nr:hypothetical protein HLPR_00740 [Clostridia bacterium S502]